MASPHCGALISLSHSYIESPIKTLEKLEAQLGDNRRRLCPVVKVEQIKLIYGAIPLLLHGHRKAWTDGPGESFLVFALKHKEQQTERSEVEQSQQKTPGPATTCKQQGSLNAQTLNTNVSFIQQRQGCGGGGNRKSFRKKKS